MPHLNEFHTDIKTNPYYTVLSVKMIEIYFAYRNDISAEEQEKLKMNPSNQQVSYDNVEISTAYSYEIPFLRVIVALETKVLLNTVHIASLKLVYQGDFMCQNVEKSELSFIDFATQNAPAIVYPYLRQGVSFFTMQAGLPVITLPVVMMKKQNHN
jgi:preprotein translocase subunit SecB